MPSTPAPATPTAAILAIGDELAFGEKLDTNTQWLAERLGAIGLRVARHLTLPDDRKTIAATIADLARTHDAVLVGGGLGPTADDLTRAALADAMADLTGRPQPLVEDQDALEAIAAFLHRVGRTLLEANRVQALRPQDASAIPNSQGTAPGLLAHVHAGGAPRIIACLPGPPREMRPMFEHALLPRLQRLPGVRPATLDEVQVFGIGESTLATAIADVMHREANPGVGTTASYGLVTCRVRTDPARAVRGPYDTDDHATARERAREIIEKAAGPNLVGVTDRPLAATLVEEAAAADLTIAVAESCTGGLLGSEVTATEGSSRAFAGGWITYSNAMKVDQLGVPPATLDRYGAVSGEVARAMADGAAARAGAGLALSITGVAGPGGGTSEKPVGTVWIGWSGPAGDSGARRFLFRGDRYSIRRWSVQTAAFLGLSAIRGLRDTPLLAEASQ